MAAVAAGSSAAAFLAELVFRLLSAPVDLAREAAQQIDELKRKLNEHDTAAEQTRLLARQVEAHERALQREAERDRRESLPFFRWVAATVLGGQNEQTCRFQNQGGPVTRLTVAPSIPPFLEARIAPVARLQANEEGNVVIQARAGFLPGSFEFTIGYTTWLGERLETRFRVPTTGALPEQID
jgi:hypothetical protein